MAAHSGRPPIRPKQVVHELYHPLVGWFLASDKPCGIGARRIHGLGSSALFCGCGDWFNVEHGADFGAGTEMRIGDSSGIGVHARPHSASTIGQNVPVPVVSSRR